MNASMHSCIHIYIYIYISFYLYHDLAIHVLSIFLSCMLLLIHIFIYVPIIHVHVLIPMLFHLFLISIVLIIYVFLSCVPSIFHLIPFGMSIIYSYHLRIPVGVKNRDSSVDTRRYFLTYTLLHIKSTYISISCSYLYHFLPYISFNFNQAISTLGTTIQFLDKIWAPNAIK